MEKVNSRENNEDEPIIQDVEEIENAKQRNSTRSNQDRQVPGQEMPSFSGEEFRTSQPQKRPYNFKSFVLDLETLVGFVFFGCLIWSYEYFFWFLMNKENYNVCDCKRADGSLSKTWVFPIEQEIL